MNTSKYEAVIEAARKIRHWHDAMNGEGMIVSSEAVRELWRALEELDNHNQSDFSGAYVYRSLLHGGYLICKEDSDGMQYNVTKLVFKSQQEAQYYIDMFTGDK